ncbi:MAG TPA: molybdate ABC transporter substrate-binding protein [Eggerthellaceae bacterium]|nr:molybdate ABC transporter substrate-binding protein [Eggerthellaceae bacterium]
MRTTGKGRFAPCARPVGKAAVGIVFLLALCMAALAGCGGQASSSASSAAGSQAERSKSSVQLQIFAANSLEQAMPLVQALYTERHPEVTFADSQFKASGDLVQEIQAGASADILITASKATMDDAEAFIVPESRVTMFGNDLELCAAKGSGMRVTNLTDLKSDQIKRIAVGDPTFVPAGKYANQSLNSADYGQPLYSSSEGEGGAYDPSIADKIAVANQVGTCAQWVASGNCDVGFVYTSDLYRYDGIESIYTVPEEMHKIITYPGAVLAGSQHQQEAEAFLKFCMTDPDALAVWQDNGFELK